MILKAFRVQMYKCIIDSGWIEVSPLTVLIGKNESGKTALLKALHKFNPFKPEPYSMEKEWPRGRRLERDDTQAVCTARFELTEEEIQELFILTNQRLSKNTMDVTRDYGGRLEVLFPSDFFPSGIHPNEVDGICARLPEVREMVGNAFSRKFEECLGETRRLAYEGRFTDLAGIEKTHVQALEAVFTPREHSLEQYNERQYLSQYAAKLKEISEKLSSISPVQMSAHEYIIKQLPTFIYMSDYSIFRGTAQLDLVKQRKDKNQLTEEDKTLLAIMDLTGLNLEEEVRKGDLSDREQRQYDLDDASVMLTQAMSDRWKQRRYEVQFRTDGQLFYTFVKDEFEPYLVQLEERSKGFQWFFSFDLMLMYESRGNLGNCVILLDEPGLHLHPDAQRDLLRRMEEYAGENTLVYTTHLPFLIDLERPECVHVLSETENGTVVNHNLKQSQLEGKSALQAALAISGSSSYMVARRNLVVESVDDFWILTELSRLLQRLGDDGLPEDLFVVPAGSAAEAIYIAAFMMEQQLDVVVLLGSDKAGYDAKDRLTKKWLPRYSPRRAQVLTLDECVGARGRELSIEDIFSEKFYLDRVQEVYKKQLALAGFDKLDLDNSGTIRKRVERALERCGIEFDKHSVTKVIRSALSRMQKPYELPQETREAGRKLIAKINAAFSHEDHAEPGNNKIINMK